MYCWNGKQYVMPSIINLYESYIVYLFSKIRPLLQWVGHLLTVTSCSANFPIIQSKKFVRWLFSIWLLEKICNMLLIWLVKCFLRQLIQVEIREPIVASSEVPWSTDLTLVSVLPWSKERMALQNAFVLHSSGILRIHLIVYDQFLQLQILSRIMLGFKCWKIQARGLIRLRHTQQVDQYLQAHSISHSFLASTPCYLIVVSEHIEECRSHPKWLHVAWFHPPIFTISHKLKAVRFFSEPIYHKKESLSYWKYTSNGNTLPNLTI